MKAEYIMNRKVISVRPEVSAEEAIKTLIQNHISGMPVVDAEGGVIGVFSNTDAISRQGSTVHDLMTTPAVYVSPDSSIAEVATLLAAKDINRVPVVADGKLVGIISRADIVRYVATKRAWDESHES
jgi:CBS domain-containing protein